MRCVLPRPSRFSSPATTTRNRPTAPACCCVNNCVIDRSRNRWGCGDDQPGMRQPVQHLARTGTLVAQPSGRPQPGELGPDAGAADLFATDEPIPPGLGPFQARIPKALLHLLESAACYHGDQRWSLLYEVLWRVSHGDRARPCSRGQAWQRVAAAHQSKSAESSPLACVCALHRAAGGAGPELPEYVAWHEPAHDILKSASEHCVGRMGRHRWMIATPWTGCDGEQLIHQRQCPEAWQQLAQNVEDPHSAMWLTYTATSSTRRLNPKVMEGHFAQPLEELAGRQVDPGLISEARTGKQKDGQAKLVGGKPGKELQTRSMCGLSAMAVGQPDVRVTDAPLSQHGIYTTVGCSSRR